MVTAVSSISINSTNTNSLSSKVSGQTGADKINIDSNLSPKFELLLNFSEDLRMFSKYFPLAYLIFVRLCTFWARTGLDHQDHHKDAYLPDSLNGLKVFPKRDSHQCFSNLSYSQSIWMKWGKFLSLNCLARSLSNDGCCMSFPTLKMISLSRTSWWWTEFWAIDGKPISPTLLLQCRTAANWMEVDV